MLSHLDYRYRTIALDCDGVLLDYSSAYADAWARAFGQRPELQNQHAYWPRERWMVPTLEGERLEHFRSVFDQHFWSTIPPADGALHACQQLADAGFDLICVTALDDHNLSARKRNLQDLGFPLKEVIATAHSAPEKSPKAKILNALMPVSFVDDFAPYLQGVDSGIHKALIVRDHINSPNTGEMLQLADSTHTDLQSFATWWCQSSGENGGGK